MAWYNGDMKKLIVKSLLKDRAAFEARAKSVGLQFSSKIWQHERVYLPHDFRPKMGYLRVILKTEVREPNGASIYVLETRRHIEASGVDIIEATTVGDYTAATAIVQQLGFQKAAEVTRSRWEAMMAANTAIYLDEVEGMEGSFLKIEVTLEDGASVDGVRKELFEILKLFGQETFVMQTYAELTREQMQPYYL